MRRLETAAALLVMVLAGTACGGDDDEPNLGAIETPTFAEDDSPDGTPTTSGDAPDGSTTTPPRDDTDSTASTAASPSASGDVAPTSTATTAVPVESVSFDDPVGDATPGVSPGTPPAWSDLAGATMERRGSSYQLRIRLGGNRAPDRSEGNATMNIATFYDVDGDGSIDHEIWVNLDAEGWGTASFDDDGASFGAASDVTVSPEGDAVVLTFPASALGTPERFRFALASEYGDLATMGSDFARRDDAPDDDRSVAFPG